MKRIASAMPGFKDVLKKAKGDQYYFDHKSGTHKMKEIKCLNSK